jgi:CDGSH-type Zn-finger protein
LTAEGGTLTIRRAPNGPLLVAGNLSIVASSGRVAWQGENAALCRCGHSNNKPFCDGAHKTAGFEAD